VLYKLVEKTADSLFSAASYRAPLQNTQQAAR